MPYFWGTSRRAIYAQFQLQILLRLVRTFFALNLPRTFSDVFSSRPAGSASSTRVFSLTQSSSSRALAKANHSLVFILTQLHETSTL
jgi:hypothetical protein